MLLQMTLLKDIFNEMAEQLVLTVQSGLFSTTASVSCQSVLEQVSETLAAHLLWVCWKKTSQLHDCLMNKPTKTYI